MSASSNCVTWGIITQLRARFAPEIFLMRDSGRTSIGPNFAKSTDGQGSRLSAPPPPMPPAAAPADGPMPLMTVLTKFCTSSCRMRPFGPAPVTRARSTPSSRANLRTDGDACAALKAPLSTGAAAAAGSIGAEGAMGAGLGAGPDTGSGAAVGAACGAGAGARASAAGVTAPASSTTISEPSATLSPSFTFNSLTTPATGDGTSIVALSDSSVTSESSAFTASPGLTKISMTGMSVKSPISGTLTSIVLTGVPPRLRLAPLRCPPRGSNSSLGTARRLSWLRLPHRRFVLHTVHGAGFAGSIPYFFIAEVTLAAGTVPSSASAFSAATVT